MTSQKLKSQIKAIATKIKNGKVKNIHAAQAKIKQLHEQLLTTQENEYWETLASL